MTSVLQRRQLTEDIIPQLTAEPQQAAKVLLEEIPKIAQRSIESIPKNPKDVSQIPRSSFPKPLSLTGKRPSTRSH
jgi:hypothetical protein